MIKDNIKSCCVFQPAFRCLHHLKKGWNTFFSHFQHFLIILNLFQWFQAWNEQKTSEMKKQVNSLRGYLKFVFLQLIFYFFVHFWRFLLISGVKSLKKVKNEHKNQIKMLSPHPEQPHKPCTHCQQHSRSVLANTKSDWSYFIG